MGLSSSIKVGNLSLNGEAFTLYPSVIPQPKK